MTDPVDRQTRSKSPLRSKHPTELAQTFYEHDLISQAAYQVLTQAIDICDRVPHKGEKLSSAENS
ncbi:MAG: hypothetical protein F6K19_32120 [Cyanothece sp. SIO1E1]|nr:hypothetical protein [Cyanothece sp. SIO1E1]